MRQFSVWFSDNYEGEQIPEQIISAGWFADHGLPMIVHCTCCETTMALPSAWVDDDDCVYCRDCAGV